MVWISAHTSCLVKVASGLHNSHEEEWMFHISGAKFLLVCLKQWEMDLPTKASVKPDQLLTLVTVMLAVHRRVINSSLNSWLNESLNSSVQSEMVLTFNNVSSIYLLKDW